MLQLLARNEPVFLPRSFTHTRILDIERRFHSAYLPTFDSGDLLQADHGPMTVRVRSCMPNYDPCDVDRRFLVNKSSLNFRGSKLVEIKISSCDLIGILNEPLASPSPINSISQLTAYSPESFSYIPRNDVAGDKRKVVSHMSTQSLGQTTMSKSVHE
jgi:hypothetical protein